jgi:hypothetical protein
VNSTPSDRRSAHFLQACLACALLSFLVLPAVSLGATPRQELLRLVPDDVGFCLLIEDLREHGKALLDSPFVKQFLTSPLAAKISKADETQKLGMLDKYLQQFLQVSADQLRDEILGDAFVLAYRPGPPNKPAQEQGLFLLRARDGKLLAALIERINKLQKDSGELKELDERTYAAKTYFRRVVAGNTSFYHLNGPILAFGSHEDILRQMLDLETSVSREADSPMSRQFRLCGVDRPRAALWINPRVFEPALRQKVLAAKGAQAVALTSLLGYWQALDGLAFTIVLEKDLELQLAVRARPEALPASARRFLNTAAEPSETWQRFPEKAMLALAGRIDAAALVEALSEFLTPEARQQLQSAVEGTVGSIVGKDIVKDLLPNLGPDWGFCVMAPPADGKEWFPQVVGALRVRPGTTGTPADLTLLNALNSLATLAVFSQNGGQPGPLSLRSALQDQVEVKYLVNEEKFLPGFQPAFAMKDNHLVVGSSPAVLRRFRAGSPSSVKPLATKEFPLLRLSFVEIARFLRERREPLIAHAAEQDHISREDAGQRLESWLAGLEFFDSLEVTQRPDKGLVVFAIRVRLSQPLK